MSDLIKFVSQAPSPQTAVDIFRGRWACDLQPILQVDGTGGAPLHTDDPRPAAALRGFGLESYAGLNILEIGPLEAAHTYLLQKMGASSIICVEASVECFLKCLIVKELLNIDRAKFLLGDICEYLEQHKQKFDLVYCSGVLYHMEDPIRLIRNISAVADKCFVWTHVYHPERHPVSFDSSRVEFDGLISRYWRHSYGEKSSQFWGGVSPTSVWMEKDDLLAAFRFYGYDKITVLEDQFDHPNGPAVLFVASRG